MFFLMHRLIGRKSILYHTIYEITICSRLINLSFCASNFMLFRDFDDFFDIKDESTNQLLTQLVVQVPCIFSNGNSSSLKMSSGMSKKQWDRKKSTRTTGCRDRHNTYLFYWIFDVRSCGEVEGHWKYALFLSISFALASGASASNNR